VSAVLWLFILLVFVPTALYGAGASVLIVAYLFGLNLVAGYTFWTRRAMPGLGRKTTALAYLVSGICFFTFLVDPVQIDTATATRLDSLDAWEQALSVKEPGDPMLAGSPVEQMSVIRRTGHAIRPWLAGLIEDVVRRPEEPRQTRNN